MNKIILLVIPFLIFSCQSQVKMDEVKDDRITQIPASLIVFQDKAGNHWFAGNESGVYRYDGTTITLFGMDDGLCSTNVLGIQEDDKGRIYFDTQDGICRFDGEHFTTLEVIDSQGDDTNWKLEPGDLWFRSGWDSNGPFRYDGEHLYHLKFPKNTQERAFREVFPNTPYNPYSVYSIYKDSKGHMWFGTSNLGVYRFDGETISWMYEDELTNIPGGGSFGIRSVIEDKEGYYWICNTHQKFDIASEAISDKPVDLIQFKELPGARHPKSGKHEFPYFMSAVVDNEGDLWFLTFELGVYHYDGEKMEHFPMKENGQQIKLFSMYKDNAGVLWLGTHNDGVYFFDGKEFKRFEV